MKKVSEHLGQIIVALAAIALLVCAVVFFKAPLGNFFGSIVDKTTSIGEEVLANADGFNVNLDGTGGSGGNGGSGETGTITLAAPGISIDGSILTITPVANAISYEVYNGDALLVTTTEATVDLSTYLSGAGTFTIRVRALADGYTSSDYVEQNYEVSGLPAPGKTAEEYTWAEINAIGEAGKADEYFQLGDTKTINMGTYGDVVMEIVAFDADTKTDGSTAAITWLSKDLIAEHVMNTEYTNAGGWEESEMRSWLQSEVYNALPDEVKGAIAEVNKTYGDYNGGSYTTKTCSDKVWIPSYREMFGGTSYESSGVTYTSHFTSTASRVKYYSGSAAWWWLRSAYSAGSAFSFVYSGGSNSGNGAVAYDSGGVALGFCTG